MGSPAADASNLNCARRLTDAETAFETPASPAGSHPKDAAHTKVLELAT